MASVDRRMLVLRGVLDLCLLALLADGPVYGYELGERLAARGLTVGGGTAYPLLARLQRNGWITPTSAASTSGPTRKYWQLTDLGRAQLVTGQRDWAQVATAVNSILTCTPTTNKGTKR